MSSLYEINQDLLDCIDLETGEIIETDKFDQLQLERNDKLESVALWYKNLLSEAQAYKAEKDVFADRQKRAENKAESLKKYLDSALHGSKFETVKVNISYRKSTSVSVDESILSAKWTREIPATRVTDKIAITKALKDGEVIAGAELVENNNIQIK